MSKYNILILSNMLGNGLKEDSFIKDAFEKDGHCVTIDAITYDEKLDETFDVIIRRNTWTSNEAETENLHINNTKLIERLSKKDIKTVNLIGLDGLGKGYLCDLFQNFENVLPTINSISKLNLLPDCEKYVIKDIKSFGSGLYQKFVTKEELKDTYTEGDIIQPLMKFKGEVQCYYIGQKLMYVYEYTPSKFPDYPEPTLVELTDLEKKISDTFAKYSKLLHGFQRIDFLRLEDDSLILMEIEDHAGAMALSKLPQEILEETLSEYTKNIYKLINS